MGTDLIRVLVLDDHRLVVDGILSMLTGSEHIEVLGAYTDSHDALQFMAQNKVDVLLTDLDMPGMDGKEVLVYCKENIPETRVVVISMHNDQATIKDLLNHGADGYLIKTVGAQEFEGAIRSVAEGRRFISEEALNVLSSTSENLRNQTLTPREIDVLKHIAEGLTSKEIADKLNISLRTVDTHRTNMFKKLEVKSVVGLVKYAITHKMI